MIQEIETQPKYKLKFSPKGKLLHISSKDVYLEFCPGMYFSINPQDTEIEINGRTIVTKTEMKLLKKFLESN